MKRALTLPAPAELERITRGLATLDAILSDDWEMRYYSFNRRWSKAERMASMRNGSGDEWFLVFSRAGAFLKGLAHEYPAGEPDEIYRGMPATLAKCLTEPAFSIDDTTYGGWCVTTWELRCAPNVKPIMTEHLALLDGDPARYRRYASDYFEVDVPLEAIAEVLAEQRLDQKLVTRINAERSLGDLKADLDEIGYAAKQR